MGDKYEVAGKRAGRIAYASAVLAASAVVENAPYLLNGARRAIPDSGAHCASRSRSSASASPCRAISLDSRLPR